MRMLRAHAQADPHWSSVVLCQNFNGNLSDQSASAKTVTAYGGAAYSTEKAQYGSGCAKLVRANSQYLSLADSADWYHGTGDFCYEISVMFASFTSPYFWTMFEQYDGTSAGTFIAMDVRTSTHDGTASVAYYGAGAGNDSASVASGLSINANTWYDFCFERAGDTLRSYLNGSVIASTTGVASHSYNNSGASLKIGAGLLDSRYLDGYIGRTRITRAARYGGAYTPHVGMFPTS